MPMKYYVCLCFAPCKTQASTHLLQRRVAGQLMQLDRSQAYVNKGMINLELYKSCHISRCYCTPPMWGCACSFPSAQQACRSLLW